MSRSDGEMSCRSRDAFRFVNSKHNQVCAHPDRYLKYLLPRRALLDESVRGTPELGPLGNEVEKVSFTRFLELRGLRRFARLTLLDDLQERQFGLKFFRQRNNKGKSGERWVGESPSPRVSCMFLGWSYRRR